MGSKNKILLTGGDGQLAKTIIFNLGKNYNIKSYPKKKIDISKLKDFKKFDKKNCKIMINTAAYNDVEGAEKNKTISDKMNYLSLINLKKFCDLNNIFLIHFSTDYVFDGKNKNPYKENSVTNPINQYGKSKAKGEKALLSSKKNNFIIIRLSWVYSKIGHNFFTKIVKLIKKNKNLKVVNDQFGVPTSTNFVVKYLNEIIQIILKKQKIPKILHLVPKGFTNWYDFSIKIQKSKFLNNKKKNSCKIIPCKSNFNNKAKRPLFSVLNS